MKKRILGALLFFLALSILFFACGKLESWRKNVFGLRISGYRVIEEEDTHGGFLGDGHYYLILDCSQDAERARSVIREWEPLPLSHNLNLMMYGGEENGRSYSFFCAEEAHWPNVAHGFYRFMDRHPEAEDPSDDSALLGRPSFNFSVAVYDTDSDILYYYELDT